MISNAFRYNAGLIRANGTPFFTGDGSTSSAQLVDRHGNPISSDRLMRLDAIHRTDWQGRQLLYPTPRTNYAKYSDVLTGSAWVPAGGGGIFAVATAIKFSGQFPYYSLTKQTAVTSGAIGQPAVATVTVGSIRTLTIALRAGTVAHASVGAYSPNDAWGPMANSAAVILSGPGVVSQGSGGYFNISGLSSSIDTLLSITRKFAVAGTAGFLVYPGGTSDSTTGHSILATRAMYSDGVEAVRGAYISTSATPVTVTDYTLTGTSVAFGEAPADGAVCDWTGVARR